MSVTGFPLAEFVALDGVNIQASDDGRLVVARDLTDDTVELNDALEIGHENGLVVDGVETDMPAGETRVVFREAA